MDLGNAIFRMVSGGRSPHRETYSDKWVTEAIARAGGVSQLARALGVHRTTVQGWQNKHKTPTLESQELLRVALRNARMSSTRETSLRAKTSITVRGEQDGRDRTIALDSKYLSAGTMDRVVTAYLRGAGPRDLQRIVWDGIHSAPFYKTLFYPGGPGAQGATPRPPEPAPRPPQEPERAPTEAGGPAAAGGYYGAGQDDFYDEEEDLIYEGWHLDGDYSMAVNSTR